MQPRDALMQMSAESFSVTLRGLSGLPCDIGVDIRQSQEVEQVRCEFHLAPPADLLFHRMTRRHGIGQRGGNDLGTGTGDLGTGDLGTGDLGIGDLETGD